MRKTISWTLPVVLALALSGLACGDDTQRPPGTADKGPGLDSGASDQPIGDHGPSGDRGAALDQGAPAGSCSAGFAGCSSFSDGTTGAPTITFPGFDYSPKCLRVKLGQLVTFSGSFSSHPLEHACGPATVITPTSTGSSKSFSFSKAGIYGYYCTLHGTLSGNGMAGAIEVIP